MQSLIAKKFGRGLKKSRFSNGKIENEYMENKAQCRNAHFISNQIQSELNFVNSWIDPDFAHVPNSICLE